MKTQSLKKAVVYSLGAHGLVLMMVIMAGSNGVKPRPALETVPFIQASLIYAMNGQEHQKAPPSVERERPARPVMKPSARPVLASIQKEEKPAMTGIGDDMTEREKETGTDVAVSLHMPSLDSRDNGPMAPPGTTPDLHAGAIHGEAAEGQNRKVRLPRYLNAKHPTYPLMARMRGQQGVVLLAVQVLADGRAGEVRIKKTSGYALLDQSALNAVRTWRFEPARNSDMPLSMTVDIPIRFSLTETD